MLRFALVLALSLVTACKTITKDDAAVAVRSETSAKAALEKCLKKKPNPECSTETVDYYQAVKKRQFMVDNIGNLPNGKSVSEALMNAGNAMQASQQRNMTCRPFGDGLNCSGY